MSRRVNYSADANENPTQIFNKHSRGGVNGGTKVSETKKKVSYKLQRSSSAFSTVSLLNRIGTKVARLLRYVSITRSSRKVSSSTLARSKSYAEPLDSHRAQALEDCIEFLNSSSTLQRSGSVVSKNS